MCGDGTCILKEWACDGFIDCANGTDEAEDFCATCPFQFLCSNDRCTDIGNVCNGADNCNDNSDEDQICVGRWICPYIVKMLKRTLNLNCISNLQILLDFQVKIQVMVDSSVIFYFRPSNS